MIWRVQAVQVIPVMVAYHTVNWIRVAIGSYLQHFPQDRILVVDNNPKRGERGWRPRCQAERAWLRAHPAVDLVDNLLPDEMDRTHGAGMDVALHWCRSKGARVMLHLEPDCLVTGTQWREKLLAAIARGAWMAGTCRKSYGPIHPTPSAWQVSKVRASFKAQSRSSEVQDRRFASLVDLQVLKEEATRQGCWTWFEKNWDTADKAWFLAALSGRTALVTGSGFKHYWNGSTRHLLSERELLVRFPELSPYLATTSRAVERLPVELCPFRENVRQLRGIETACCRLLQEISGVENARRCRVRRDACEACCDSFRPSAQEINPVIASQLYALTDTVIERGGEAGCDAGKAAELQQWAEVNLELVDFDEKACAVAPRVVTPCCHLGAEIGYRIEAAAQGHTWLPVFACAHPAHRETTPAECVGCRDWRARPGPDPVPLEQLLPVPRERVGPRLCRWAVAVTTAPRRQATLELCLDSLARAGWDRPRLFVDSAVTIADRFSHFPVTFRESKVGAWPNYYLALAEQLLREPQADAFLMVQDDVIFYDRHNLREYLEQALWPAHPIAALSLYCSQAYTRRKSGWHRHRGKWAYGALAFVFPRMSAKRFIADALVLEHRWSGPGNGRAGISSVIGAWASRHRLPIYYPTPSLVQHVGDTSAVWPQARAAGCRRADQFAGDVE